MLEEVLRFVFDPALATVHGEALGKLPERPAAKDHRVYHATALVKLIDGSTLPLPPPLPRSPSSSRPDTLLSPPGDAWKEASSVQTMVMTQGRVRCTVLKPKLLSTAFATSDLFHCGNSGVMVPTFEYACLPSLTLYASYTNRTAA
jgi:hypothetical protein